MSKDFTEGEWEFTFPNQDKYKGHYCAHVSGLAWREGAGVYSTHDGQIYEGIWKDDKLDETENLQITFPNMHRYVGKISKHKYNGPGTYYFKANGRFVCNFVNNKPVGDVIFIDQYDKMWFGKALNDQVMLKREHVFSYELDSERGKGVPLHPPPIESAEEVAPEEVPEELDLKELEKQVFAKSTKTPAGLNFEESEWYKSCENFTDMYKTVIPKMKHLGAYSLTNVERAWLKQFLAGNKTFEDFKKQKRKQSRPPYVPDLRDYLIETMKKTCPPTSVFYPTRSEEQVEQ